MPCRIAVFLWSTALIQQWPGLDTVIRPSTLGRLPEPIQPSPAEPVFDGHLTARINTFYPFHVAFVSSAMPRLKRLLCFGRPPLREFPKMGESTYSWVASHTLARLDGRFDALQQPRCT
jgi:hypothetical protein